jgi:DNA polymerase-4
VTVGELARADEDLLGRAFGPAVGPLLRRLARGEDDVPAVGRAARARSRGREHTFERDLRHPLLVERAVERLAEHVCRDLLTAGREAEAVTVTLRYAPFETHSHTIPVEPPSNDPQRLSRAAAAALRRFELDRPVRLVGVRAELAPAARHRGRRRVRVHERQLSLL